MAALPGPHSEAKLPRLSVEAALERIPARAETEAGLETLGDPDAFEPGIVGIRRGAFVAAGRSQFALPISWCQGRHQRVRPAWSVPLSRAVTRMSLCDAWPSRSCVHTITASSPSK
jgi:hypothetical protein